MYQKTQDRGDYLDRVASHATKGSGRGTVWWARDQFDPFQERASLNRKRRLLKKQWAVLLAAGALSHKALRKHKQEMQRLREEIKSLPRRPPKLPTVSELLTDTCPPGMNIHKFRRLQRRAGRHI